MKGNNIHLQTKINSEIYHKLNQIKNRYGGNLSATTRLMIKRGLVGSGELMIK